MKNRYFKILVVLLVVSLGVLALWFHKDENSFKEVETDFLPIQNNQDSDENEDTNIDDVTPEVRPDDNDNSSLKDEEVLPNKPDTTNKPGSSNSNKPTESNKPNISKPSESDKKEPSSEVLLPDASVPSKPSTIDEMLLQMTLDEKIAQMCIISFEGTSLTSKIKDSMAYKPGGVILFGNNIKDYETTKKLIQDIKSLASGPLFVSIDQEGGRVQRIKDIGGVEAIPPMWEIGSSNDVNKAYLTGKKIGNDLQKFGINMDFAPVVDVVPDILLGAIKDRSFGSDPIMVGKMGTSLAKGLIDTGVVPAYKHFPGHGATITDSHVSLPVVTKTKEQLMESDLIPFKEAILKNAPMIMVGHIAVPSLSGSNMPASLSKTVITDLLKTELGFKGLVITDALNMKAIVDNYSEKEIYEMAINAGVDILLMPKSVQGAINNIKQSVSEGKIKESKINQSVKKILELKKKM